jgi:hypothetical protein
MAELETIEDFMTIDVECQICGTQGDLETCSAVNAKKTLEEEGWAMAEYKDAPETRTLCCKTCAEYIPTLSI